MVEFLVNVSLFLVSLHFVVNLSCFPRDPIVTVLRSICYLDTYHSSSRNQLNDVGNNRLGCPSNKARHSEVEVKQLTQLSNTVVNQMFSPKLHDPTILLSLSSVLNRNMKLNLWPLPEI